MKKWKCTVCGYIHEGENPPERCPRCRSPKEVFIPYDETSEDSVTGRPYESGDTVTDVVVVGSGAAAFSAAVTARSKGSEVIMLEKAKTAGGTTLRSGGGYWIPNNHLQRAAGHKDNKDDALRYMARYSYPDLYNSGDDRYGLTPHQFDLINSFYDYASEMTEYFEEIDAIKSILGIGWNGKAYCDYAEFLPENKGIRGRILFSKNDKGEMGFGLIAHFREWAETNGITIVTDCRVTDVIKKDKDVIGVEALAGNEKVRFYARQGVIFGTGGYSHNEEFMQNFQPGPIYGGCSVPTNTGDFISIAGRAGAKIGNMRGAFRSNSIAELYLEDSNNLTTVFFIPGDSSILVNKYGKRYVNEKRNYNDRGKKHFEWDSEKAEYKNMLTFLITDERTATMWQGHPPFPVKGDPVPDYLMVADSLDGLADKISGNLKDIAGRVGNFSLDSSFKENLRETVENFNRYAEEGKDPEFGRGDFDYDKEWSMMPPAEGNWPDKDSKNITMHPMDKTPYYAVILGSGTLDTNGGPVIDGRSRVLDWNGNPIESLYGAGNCIAAPSADTYWGGGGTIGPAMTFGYIAGKQVSSRDRKDNAGGE